MKKVILPVILMSLLITACGTIATQPPKVLPTVVLDGDGSVDGTPVSTSVPFTGTISASGEIVPAQMITIASSVGGRVQSFRVLEGESVKAGQVMALLTGADQYIAALSAAKMELLSAEQALEDLNSTSALAKGQAQIRLAKAKDELDKAKTRRASKEYRIGDENQIAIAKAELILAEDRLKKTEEQYGRIARRDVENLNKAAALTAISNARKARDKAQTNLEYLKSLPDVFDLGIAEAELVYAQAEVDNAQLEFDKYISGPPEDVLGLAQARVDTARAQVEANQALLNELEIKAPFAGTLSKTFLHTGEYAAPGQSLLVLADLKTMQVETSDLSERDVAAVKIGQTVSIVVKALNSTLTGKVSKIAIIPDELGGDVVYKTTIVLDKIPDDLRVGMSVEVQYGD